MFKNLFKKKTKKSSENRVRYEDCKVGYSIVPQEFLDKVGKNWESEMFKNQIII